MTAQTAAELLDQVDALHAAIGDSPAFRVIGFQQDDEDVLAQFDDGGTGVFAECYGTDAAALIVAAVNALPALVAALRAVLELADQWDDMARDHDDQGASNTAMVYRAHARLIRRALGGGRG